MYINLGLLGYPLSHSLSPSLHSRFLADSGINGGYVCLESETAEGLSDVFSIIKKFNFTGINVTIPYKESVINYISEIDPLAEEIGAVNTIFFNNGVAKGFNTDVFGFAQTLRDNNINLSGKSVLMLGCGGAAKAVLRCLKDFEGLRLTLINRDIAKAERVLKSLNFDNAEIVDYNYLTKNSAADVVINATSLGLDGGAFADMCKNECAIAAIDLQYKKTLTPFLKCYQKSRCELIDGFSMLFHQAHRAFEIWTGVKAPTTVADLTKICGDIN